MPLSVERWGDRLRRIMGKPIERDLSTYRARLAAILELADGLAGVSDIELAAQARALRDRAGVGPTTADLEPLLFAMFKEAGLTS